MRNSLTWSSLALALTLSIPAWSADAPKTEPSAEHRQKMAEVHQKMADCLKSDRPLNECRDEMMKSCKDSMGEEGCPMMGHGMGHGAHAPKKAKPAQSR